MAPKAKLSKPPPRFLFVNGDASTVNRTVKDPEIDRQKQSHVQRHNFANRKQLKGQPLSSRSNPETTTTAKPVDPPQSRRQDLVWGSFDAYLLANQQTHSSIQQISQVTDTSFEQVYQPGFFFHSSPTRGSKRPQTADFDFPLLQAPLQGRALHPLFSGSSQILEKWAPPLMQYFNTVVIPEKFPSDIQVRPLGQIRHAAAIHADCTKALTAPVHLYAFLTEASTRMLLREGRLLLPDVKEEDYYRVPLFFKTKALAALRNALESGLTHDLVADVHRFVAAAYHSHDYETAETHVEALMSMVESLGGLRTFGDYFEETSILLDWSVALKKLKAPRLPLDWDPGQGSPEIAALQQSLDSPYDGLGKRMLPILEGQIFRPELSVAFQDMVQLSRFRRWTMSRDTYEPEHFRYILLRHTAIGCRLLILGDDSPDDSRGETLRITMIFWTALTRSPASGRRCAAESIGRLRAILESGQDVWVDHPDLFLWISTVGGLTAMTDEDIDWFASLTVKATKKINNDSLMDLADMEKVLSGFLYEPSMQREPLLDFRARMRRVNGI